MPRCLSEGVDIFLKSAERQGGANRTFKASGRCHGWQLEPCPYGLELLYHFSLENSHLETRHQGVMFRSPWAFVRSTATLRYEPCTQFINVSQKALHIYFIDGCRRIKIERNNLLCEQAPTEVFRSIFAWLVTLNLLNQITTYNLLLYLRISLRLQIIAQIGNSLIHCFRNDLR